jgi:hypothetical protein
MSQENVARHTVTTRPSNLCYMPKKADRSAETKAPAAESKQELVERLKKQGMSKGAMAAERASAGIGTDDRDPDNWFRPTRRL